MSTARKRYVILTPFDDPLAVAGVAALHGIAADVASTGAGVVVVHDLPVKEYTDWDIAELLGSSDELGNELGGELGDELGSEPDDELGDERVADAPSRPAVNAAAGEVTESAASPRDGENSPATSAPAVDSVTSAADITDDPIAAAKVFSQLTAYGVILFQAELGDGVGGEEGVSGLVRAQRVLRGKLGEEIPAGLLINTLSPDIEQLVLGLKDITEVAGAVIHPDEVMEQVRRMYEGDQDANESPAESDNSAGDAHRAHE